MCQFAKLLTVAACQNPSMERKPQKLKPPSVVGLSLSVQANVILSLEVKEGFVRPMVNGVVYQRFVKPLAIILEFQEVEHGSGITLGMANL